MRMRSKRKKSGGQVMVEYAMMLVMFTLMTIAIFFLLAGLMDHGWRILALIAWEPFV